MEKHKLSPKIGVGVLVLFGNKVMLLKRKGSHGAVTWCLGGGHLEYGETIADCAKREVCEETGLFLDKIEIICVNEELDYVKTDQKHYVTIGCLAKVENEQFENKEPDKHIDIHWFDINKLPSPLFPASEHIIQCFLNNKFTI